MNYRFRTPEKSSRATAQKLIVFQAGKERYAIAIDRVQRVLKEFTAQGTRISGQSLVKYNNETITLIDLPRLFIAHQDTREPHYLIVCSLSPGESLGIPVAEMPSVLEVSEAQFGEIPALYRQGEIPAAVEKLIDTPDGTVVFFLNLERLIAETCQEV